MSIRIFTSTDRESNLAAIIRRATKQDRSHCGLHHTEYDITYEQRLKCGYYPWSDYENPGVDVDEWEVVGASHKRIMEAFRDCRDLFHGQRYAYGQILAFLPYLFWRGRGKERDMRITKYLVCSELVWHFIDCLGGQHSKVLWRCLPEKDEVTPGDLLEVLDGYPKLFRRIKR